MASATIQFIVDQNPSTALILARSLARQGYDAREMYEAAIAALTSADHEITSSNGVPPIAMRERSRALMESAIEIRALKRDEIIEILEMLDRLDDDIECLRFREGRTAAARIVAIREIVSATIAQDHTSGCWASSSSLTAVGE